MNSWMLPIPALIIRTVVVIAGILFVICAPLKLAEAAGFVAYSGTFMGWLDALLGGVNYVFIGFTFWDCLIGWIKTFNNSSMQMRTLGISLWSAIVTFFVPMLAATITAVMIFVFTDAWWTGVAMYVCAAVTGLLVMLADAAITDAVKGMRTRD
jgi:hypothetical protein